MLDSDGEIIPEGLGESPEKPDDSKSEREGEGQSQDLQSHKQEKEDLEQRGEQQREKDEEKIQGIRESLHEREKGNEQEDQLTERNVRNYLDTLSQQAELRKSNMASVLNERKYPPNILRRIGDLGQQIFLTEDWEKFSDAKLEELAADATELKTAVSSLEEGDSQPAQAYLAKRIEAFFDNTTKPEDIPHSVTPFPHTDDAVLSIEALRVFDKERAGSYMERMAEVYKSDFPDITPETITKNIQYNKRNALKLVKQFYSD